jgi:3-isopropylmalate dehydratase small subunit
MDEANRVKLTGDVEKHPDSEIIIDLEGMQVVCANATYPIQMKASTREAFLTATFDPLDNLLRAKSEIHSTAKKLGYA